MVGEEEPNERVEPAHPVAAPVAAPVAPPAAADLGGAEAAAAITPTVLEGDGSDHGDSHILEASPLLEPAENPMPDVAELTLPESEVATTIPDTIPESEIVDMIVEPASSVVPDSMPSDPSGSSAAAAPVETLAERRDRVARKLQALRPAMV